MTEGRLRAAAGFPVAVALALAGSGLARAEPYIGLRAGRPCAACHVNVTGGGMRNAHGVMFGLTALPWRGAPTAADDPTYFRGRVADNLHVGADLRASHTSTFSVSADDNAFDVDAANLYADLQLVRGRVHLYLDERVAPGAARSREAFALLEDLPGRLYVKAGRFFPPYGWRLLDDEAFIRTVPGYGFNLPDDGVEVGWTPGRLAGSLAVTNGAGGASEQDDHKQVSMLAAFTHDRFRAGVSGSANRRGDEDRRFAGILAGARLGPLVFLGEADAGRVEALRGLPPPPGSVRDTVRQVVTYAEVDWLVHGGLNLKVHHDYLDPDTSQNGDEVDRVGAAVEATPAPYIQLRILFRRTDRPREVRGIFFEDDREVVAELHVYL
jgi:hypothetical protein